MQRSVVTVDLAKRMRDAGWIKPVDFYWWMSEHTVPRWSLGRVKNEPVMIPAPRGDEIIQEFDPNDLSVCLVKDGYIALAGGFSIKKYRFVDALGELWLVVKNKARYERT